MTIKDDHEWNVHAEFLHLPNYIIKGAGLVKSTHTDDLVLYNRPACRQQVKFIQESVIANGKDGFIFGQPGTGKSTTTFFACCVLRREYDIVWIHVAPDKGYAEIVTIQGNYMRKVKVPRDQVFLNVSLKKMDDKHQRTSQTILVLDSFNFTTPEAERLLRDARWWRENDLINRRLITVSSMGCFDKSEKKVNEYTKRHGVGSWSLEEYMEAIKRDDLWESVRHAFSGIQAVLKEREELVKAKFYYAGTSARFMFGLSIEEIKDAITSAMRVMSPRTRECTSTESILSNAFKHSLISFIYEPDCVFRQAGFVSQHAARTFGAASKAGALRSLAAEGEFASNSQARGWVFEAYFLACASEKSDLVLRKEVNSKKSKRAIVTWSCPQPDFRRICVFTPQSLNHKLPLDTWLRPDSPQQPGFDAVMLLSNGLIRFIQTTVAQEHDLKMWALANLVTRLQQLGHEVTDAEVFFVIPDDAFAKNFVITELHGWEQFVKLFKSWPKKLENVKKKLQTVMIGF